MTIVTGPVFNVGKEADRGKWRFFSKVRQGTDDPTATITPTLRIATPNINGILTVELDPGFCTVQHGNWSVDVMVPDVPSIGLWALIGVATNLPPGTPDEKIAAAITAYWLRDPVISHLTDEEVLNLLGAGAAGAEVLTAPDMAVLRNTASVVGRGDRPRNILDYGVSIGTSDSQTSAIKTALNAYAGATFVFPRGDYRLNTGLVVDSNNSLRIDHDARIYAGAAMDTLISYDNGQASVGNWAQDKCIVGEGVLDGALLASKVLTIARVIRMSVDDFTISDGINRGLYTAPLGAEVIFRNVRIHNTGTTNVVDNIAIESDMADCLFQDFIIRDCTVGVRDNSGNVWSNVHPWIGSLAQLTARYANSIGFDLNGNSVLLNPYADTYRTSYKVRPGKRARIIMPRAYCNQGNLSNALATANPGTVLDLDTTSIVQFIGAELEGHPTTKHTFITGLPTRLTAHTNNVVRGVTGQADYQDGVRLRAPEQYLPATYDDFTATDGTALDTARWTVTKGAAAAAGITTNGNRARLTSGATGSYSAADRAFMKSTLAPLADVEILVRHTYGVIANESYTRYALRASTADPQVGDSYFVVFTNSSIILSKTVAGVGSNIGGGSLAFLGFPPATDGSSKWLRFRAKGSFIAFKVWDDGTDEPVQWTQALTDTSVTAAGNVVASISGGSAATSVVTYLDRFSVIPLDDMGLPESVAARLNGKQPLDTDLTAIAALVSAADKLAYATGAGTWALTNFTAAARALLDDADDAAQRATLGLNNVDNTRDIDKPVSTAQAAAITAAVNGLINGAPGALDTLKELADAVDNNASFAAAVMAAFAIRPKVLTGTTATVIGTTTKVVNLDSPFNAYTPVAGDELRLTFTNGSNGAISLAINGGSAVPVQTPSGTVSGTDHVIAAGYSARYYFDGTRWQTFGTTLSVSEISAPEIIDANGSNFRLITGRRAAYLKRKAINTVVTSSATPAISLDLGDWSTISVAHNITAITTTGTGNDLQTVNLKLVGTGAYSLAFGSAWNFGFGVAAPSSIANGKALYIQGRWNATTSKIDVLDVKQES